MGSRATGLSLGGTVDASVNINQLDPQYLALGSALQEQLPNPFLGNPSFGAFSTVPTLSRGQLLRPYPQFGNVLAHRVTASRSRYDAFVVSGERRQHGGWGARVNYTYSVLKDNQSGEGNAFANNPVALINNYDLEREYGYSMRDTPHRLNLSATLEHRGWTLSAVGVYQSGFPIAVVQMVGANPANAFGLGQRPNLVPGVAPLLTSDPADSYDPSRSCVRWLNPAAWSLAPAFTLGNAPHADPTRGRPCGRPGTSRSARLSPSTVHGSHCERGVQRVRPADLLLAVDQLRDPDLRPTSPRRWVSQDCAIDGQAGLVDRIISAPHHE